jgi:hypothetical protein
MSLCKFLVIFKLQVFKDPHPDKYTVKANHDLLDQQQQQLALQQQQQQKTLAASIDSAPPSSIQVEVHLKNEINPEGSGTGSGRQSVNAVCFSLPAQESTKAFYDAVVGFLRTIPPYNVLLSSNIKFDFVDPVVVHEEEILPIDPSFKVPQPRMIIGEWNKPLIKVYLGFAVHPPPPSVETDKTLDKMMDTMKDNMMDKIISFAKSLKSNPIRKEATKRSRSEVNDNAGKKLKTVNPRD